MEKAGATVVLSVEQPFLIPAAWPSALLFFLLVPWTSGYSPHTIYPIAPVGSCSTGWSSLPLTPCRPYPAASSAQVQPL